MKTSIIILVTAFIIAAYAISACAAGDLVAWYKFDETSGTTAFDSSGSGKNATLVNGPTWPAGLFGNAVNLDGTNDHLTIPAGIVSALGDFSISCWVKLDTVSNWARIFDFGTGTTVNMFLTPKSGSSTLRFAITTSGTGGEQQINGTAALPTGTWKYVVVTHSGNIGILYVDGVEVGRNTSMTKKPSDLGSTTLNYIGRSQYSDPYLDGLVDDFRIYNRALTVAEISDTFTATAGCIALVKKQALASPVTLMGKAVTGAYSGYFYIQCPQDNHPACGIKVSYATAQTVGATVTVNGALAKDPITDELMIQATSVVPATGNVRPKVRGCINRNIGGATIGNAQGPDGGGGPNMVGVLQITWGKVSNVVSGTSMTIDDGSRCPVKVYGPIGTVGNGDFVRVTGVSSIEKDGGKHVRIMRLRDSSDIPGGTQIAGSLLVNLDARNVGDVPGTWVNQAPGLGDFAGAGNPSVQTVGGQTAMVFDGIDDAFIGPVAPTSITGASNRSIELWVYNPTIDSAEETMIAWGKRGTGNADCAFNWGSNSSYGAFTGYGADMGWGGTPSPGKWHHLVLTYNGSTVSVYDNATLSNSKSLALSTAAGQHINLAAQNSSAGAPLFLNEFNGTQMAGSIAIAIARIHTGVLTSSQINANFDKDAARFGAVRPKNFDERLVNPITLSSNDLTVKLFSDNNAIISLSPSGSTFDFTPGDRLRTRVSSGNFHLGDIDLGLRTEGGSWQTFKSVTAPDSAAPVTFVGGVATNLTPAFGAACPISVERRWMNVSGKLVLRFVLTNNGTDPVEVGSLGAPMVFNNVFTDRNLTDTHEKCSFVDPYIGGDAGYVQVTRVSGAGPTLIVYPEPGNQFEAYRHLREDPLGLGVTFEGFYEWMPHTKAYVENEWSGHEEWNPGTSRVLAGGESATYGFVLTLSPTIKGIENTLLANSRPVAIGVPGYVITQDQPARLFIKHTQAIQSISVDPVSAITVIPDPSPTPNGWLGFSLTANVEGRSRLIITYDDGAQQFIHYYAVPSQQAQVTRLADFHETHQWYTNLADPFHRAYSYMLYDRDADVLLDQESRQFDVGESDEVGAGPNLLMAMKNNMMPDPTQVAHMEQYVDNVLWGNLQYTTNYGVKASLFYWDPVEFPNYYTVGQGWGWDKARGETTWRSYNYPHQAAIYWSLYRLARNYTGLVTHHTWDWYLTQAYKTGIGMRDLGGYNDKGLMDGSVFLEILKDMVREGWTTQMTAYETFFHNRATTWSTEAYPFGSEMPWDSTGQEEVYQWCKYYGYPTKAQESLNVITAYMPTVPNWSYNGAARRYWDSAVYGKIPMILRQSGHYGSSLNAIPAIDSYRDNPSDLYLLRIGYGATMNVLPNINQEGHGSQSFIPDVAFMSYEPYTGDFGSAFFGYAYNSGAYAVNHGEFGWLGFGCAISGVGPVVGITPTDAFHRRVYIAPLGLWLTLDSGTFDRVDYNTSTGAVTAVLSPATANCPTALLLISRPGAPGQPAYHPTVSYTIIRGGYSIPLGGSALSVVLTP